MPNMEIIQQLVKDVGLEGAQKLIGMFQDDVIKRIQIIQDHVDQGGDLKDLHLQAHSLKGLCRTYGAIQGGEAAMELQAACDSEDKNLIQEKALAALNIIPVDMKAAVNFMNTLASSAEHEK